VSPVQSCKGCGGLFSFLPRGLCTGCIDAREEQFHAVRDYLADNRGASVAQACLNTEVPEKVIAEFIREGRIQVVGDGAGSPAGDAARDALKARIAQDMAARGAQAPPPGAPDAAKRSGMRTRTS